MVLSRLGDETFHYEITLMPFVIPKNPTRVTSAPLSPLSIPLLNVLAVLDLETMSFFVDTDLREVEKNIMPGNW